MPIHEYSCCDRRFEKIVRLDEKIYCDKCKKEVKPLISKSTFMLKGGGWACSGYNKEK